MQRLTKALEAHAYPRLCFSHRLLMTIPQSSKRNLKLSSIFNPVQKASITCIKYHGYNTKIYLSKSLFSLSKSYFRQSFRNLNQGIRACNMGVFVVNIFRLI